MRRLVILLVIVAALGTAGDVGARKWAENQIESRAQAELPGQVVVSAHIKAFPFIPTLLLTGKVSEAGGHFENVPVSGLVLAAVDVDLHGVKVNRNKLINARKVELVSIDSGTVTVDIASAELAKRLGLPVAIAGGVLKVTNAATKVTVQNNALVFDLAGVSKRIPIPKTRLVPCATSVTLLADRVRLSCTIHEIPPALLGAANRSLSGA